MLVRTLPFVPFLVSDFLRVYLLILFFFLVLVLVLLPNLLLSGESLGDAWTCRPSWEVTAIIREGSAGGVVEKHVLVVVLLPPCGYSNTSLPVPMYRGDYCVAARLGRSPSYSYASAFFNSLDSLRPPPAHSSELPLLNCIDHVAVQRCE